jgi:hypothetical protein
VQNTLGMLGGLCRPEALRSDADDRALAKDRQQSNHMMPIQGPLTSTTCDRTGPAALAGKRHHSMIEPRLLRRSGLRCTTILAKWPRGIEADSVVLYEVDNVLSSLVGIKVSQPRDLGTLQRLRVATRKRPRDGAKIHVG